MVFLEDHEDRKEGEEEEHAGECSARILHSLHYTPYGSFNGAPQSQAMTALRVSRR
jgi:hypothetical protein